MYRPHSTRSHRYNDYDHDEYRYSDFHTDPYQYQVDNSPYPYLNGYSTPNGYQRKAETLYGDPLVAVCKETRDNLHRLRKTLTNVDPCYQFGVQHWHFSKAKPEPDAELPEHMRPKWKAQETIFTSQKDMKRIDWKRPHSGNVENEPSGPVNKYCYICTTLDEHQQHLARRGPQLKAKEKRKQRVDFIVPLPEARIKRAEVEEKEEYLYKITIKTGNKPNAGTSAKVFIRLKGKEGVMKPRQLFKKTVNFTFGRDTNETFYIKTPMLGHLRSLVIYHDGLEKKHSWLLDEVEVCDVAARQVYIFTFRQWLSLHVGDCSNKVELPAQAVEKFQREYLINVTTGNKTLAGTDANVTLTLIGKLGSSSKLRLTRKVKDRETLQRGATDSFSIASDDIGPLQKIRIEHDNTGRSPDWFLEKVEVEESEQLYLFPCGRWIPADDEQDRSKVSLELFPVRNSRAMKVLMKAEAPKKDREDTANLLSYHVTVLTGDVRGAGTDANVFLVLIGKTGKSREIVLDDEKNNFERGMTDEFKIKAEDVGFIKKIRIHHDDSSLAPGWFLEKVIIRRFFTREEIREKLASEGVEEDEKALRRASMITGKAIKGRDVDKMTKKKYKTSRKGKGDSESEEDSSDEYTKGKNRKDKKKKRGESESDSDDEKEKKKKKGKKKKKYTYGGIDTWVTESDSDSEDDESKSKKSKKKKKGSKYDSDDSDDSKKRSRNKKGKKKGSKYNTDDSDDSRAKYKNEKGKKKGKSKYLDSDTDSDSDSEDDKKTKKKKSRKADSDSERDTRKSQKNKKKSRKSKDTDSDSEYDKKKKKSSMSKSKKTRFAETDSGSSDSDSESSSGSDSDKERKKKKKKKKGSVEEGRRKAGSKDTDSSEDERDYSGKLYQRWAEDRVPFCDEYEFVCRRWLATDEDDRQIQRELKPTSITTFYRKN